MISMVGWDYTSPPFSSSCSLVPSVCPSVGSASNRGIGALFPMCAKKVPRLHIPNVAFTFAKFFGSGVIIATAFIHLLASSFAELGDPCLSTFWDVDYPWSAAFSMIAVFSLFLVELFAMRVAHMQFATTDALGKDAEDEEVTHEHGTTYGPPAALSLEEGKLQND